MRPGVSPKLATSPEVAIRYTPSSTGISRVFCEVYDERCATKSAAPVLPAPSTAFCRSLASDLLHHLGVLRRGSQQTVADRGRQRRFIDVLLSVLHQMTCISRARLIWLLVEKELLAEEFTQNLLSWKNSDFSIDNSVCLTDAKSKKSCRVQCPASAAV